MLHFLLLVSLLGKPNSKKGRSLDSLRCEQGVRRTSWESTPIVIASECLQGEAEPFNSSVTSVDVDATWGMTILHAKPRSMGLGVFKSVLECPHCIINPGLQMLDLGLTAIPIDPYCTIQDLLTC